MDVQTISIAVAAIGVFIAAINSVISSRKADEQRQMELISQIYNRFLDKDLSQDYAELVFQWEFTDYEDYKPKYSFTTGRFNEFYKFVRFTRFMSYVGELINSGVLDMKYVSSGLANNIIRFWEKFEPVLIGARITLNTPTAYTELESAYHKVKQRYSH